MTNPNRLTRYCACGATLVLLSSKDAEPRDAMTVIEAFLDIHRDRPGHGPGSQVSAALRQAYVSKHVVEVHCDSCDGASCEPEDYIP